MSIPPSIYVRLIYHEQCKRKYWLIFILVFLLILYVIHVIQRESYYDCIVVGSGRYPGILNTILEEEGKKTLLLLPTRMSGITLHFQDHLHSWERLPLTSRNIEMHPLNDEELLRVSSITGLPLESLGTTNKELTGGLFDIMSLTSAGKNVRRTEISSVTPAGEVQDIQGNTYLSPEIYLVEPCSIPLLEKFVDLNNPREVTILTEGGDKYTSPCSYDPVTGFYLLEGGKDVWIQEMLFEPKDKTPAGITLLDSLLLTERGLILYLLTKLKGA